MARETRPGHDQPIVLDVRTQDEFRQGYAGRAVNTPVQELPLRASELRAPGQHIFASCRSGAWPGGAAALLRKLGHRVENCVDPAGGERRVKGDGAHGWSAT